MHASQITSPQRRATLAFAGSRRPAALRGHPLHRAEAPRRPRTWPRVAWAVVYRSRVLLPLQVSLLWLDYSRHLSPAWCHGSRARPKYGLAALNFDPRANLCYSACGAPGAHFDCHLRAQTAACRVLCLYARFACCVDRPSRWGLLKPPLECADTMHCTCALFLNPFPLPII